MTIHFREHPNSFRILKFTQQDDTISSQNTTSKDHRNSTNISAGFESIIKEKNSANPKSEYLFPTIDEIEKALDTHITETYLGISEKFI